MRLSAFVLFCVYVPALAQTNDPSSAAKAAWTRMLKARGMGQASITSVVVIEQSSRAKLKATYVHSDSRDWWIFWDHRPSKLGATLEVYDIKARTGTMTLAQRDEFVGANPVGDYDRRIDFRLQFLATYEPNSTDLQAIPSSINPCENDRDCLTVNVKDRVITYELDRKTSLPAKITLDIPSQPAGPRPLSLRCGGFYGNRILRLQRHQWNPRTAKTTAPWHLFQGPGISKPRSA